ncbi:hypothetical protein QWI17_07900 [Gilvimarinus sp. SDUM040013]|uniref:Uncharacterized protein n=1 Tax=Gilvimarinus gilvus TaxID=3058038 RepID=A0ABU4RYR8_9GAMM|nr:hypothetical protein [Gilvimarinus sp. SDUM040013]MDO3385756.1 hypothetical protein [Gilvimarinus sp. SDUM040013]MDX6849396.1 hypothetical protein [Gilvimarinus sp. SDUM040013]
MKKWLLMYGVGSAAALIAAVLHWVLARYGFSYELGADFAPSIGARGLYPKLVWGGVAGWLLLLPLAAGRWLMRSVIIALVPTLVQLLIIYPVMTGYGFAGLSLGIVTPLIVFSVFWCWALIAVAISRLI